MRHKAKKRVAENTCVECGGELEAVDNQNSHTNLKTCISNLKAKIDSLFDEINYPEG